VKPFRKTIADLLGFDRRERRGTYILAAVLIILLFVRVFSLRPDKELLNSEVNADSLAMPELTVPAEQSEKSLFIFDPNTVSFDSLVRLGLTEKQATTLINYRTSGARFRMPKDIERVYGIDSGTVVSLLPWIKIPKETERHKAGGENTAAVIHGKQAETVIRPAFIDLNRCSADDLLQLPGIGPVLSARIIKYRSLLGGFIDAGQLKEVYGLDSSVVDLICERLTLTYDSVRPLLLDSCSFSELARHPYIGPATAGLIIKYRSLMGTPVTLGGLVRQKVLSSEQASRLAPYIRPSPGIAGDDFEFILSKVLK
jgi:DNA uptake protein ComE-like DNA-binding protein